MFSKMMRLFFLLIVHVVHHGMMEALSVAPSPKLQRSSTVLTTAVATSTTTTIDNNWKHAKKDLQSKDCCVVSIGNNDNLSLIQPHLELLQLEVADHGPPDVDLRTRIRTSSPESSTVIADCSKVLESVLGNTDIENSNDGSEKIKNC